MKISYADLKIQGFNNLKIHRFNNCNIAMLCLAKNFTIVNRNSKIVNNLYFCTKFLNHDQVARTVLDILQDRRFHHWWRLRDDSAYGTGNRRQTQMAE